ncbi:hypothetical protein O6H91_Y549300 [Diphasiastrum complanatum]|nr:hypothetical protein O6H91_Y549300 [Diphasiastrum complanatum]
MMRPSMDCRGMPEARMASTGPSQPNPFRRYLGARVVLSGSFPPIYLPAEGLDPLYPAVFLEPQHPEDRSQWRPCRSFCMILWLFLPGKTAGRSTWSLRVNPSSGNLQPTEGYVISCTFAWNFRTSFCGSLCPQRACSWRFELNCP